MKLMHKSSTHSPCTIQSSLADSGSTRAIGGKVKLWWARRRQQVEQRSKCFTHNDTTGLFRLPQELHDLIYEDALPAAMRTTVSCSRTIAASCYLATLED
jgi:hypothetical protein